MTNFASEWLKLRDIDTIDPDPFIYPNFDPSLRTAFRRELELFVDSIQREDRSVLDLLTANYTFVNERLALHYGIPNVRGEEFRRVILPDSSRYGLLGKGAILMVTSYANRTSVVLRGNYILENITRYAAFAAAAQRPGLQGKQGRREAAHRAGDDGDASRQSDLQRLPWNHGPAGIRARKLRHRGRVAQQGPLYAHRHRCLRQADGRHRGQRAGRSAQGADVASRPVRRKP